MAAKAAAVLAESVELNANELITEDVPVGLGGFVMSKTAAGTIAPVTGPTCVAGVLGTTKGLAGKVGGGRFGVVCSFVGRQHGSNEGSGTSTTWPFCTHLRFCPLPSGCTGGGSARTRKGRTGVLGAAASGNWLG